MKINLDCRHFKGSMPCLPHKQKGVHCEDCPDYDKIGKKILVVKLDAVGDVLRTTSILPGLKEKYPAAHITWITRKEAVPLFKGNVFVDLVLEYGAEAFLRIAAEFYDVVINTDASPESAIVAERVSAAVKIGFGYDARGHVYPISDTALKWFEMGVFDDIKKANTETYQKIISNMIGIRSQNERIMLEIDGQERRFAAEFAGRSGLGQGRPRIGLNTGAGGRWEKKKWTVEGFCALIELIRRDMPGAVVLLYGGPEEKERNSYLKERFGDFVVDTGCENSLREFFALVELCDIFVTGDTMALHAAVALGKKVVAIFGPTSSVEIELYGQGKKVYAGAMDCLSCYHRCCDKKPDCMESIAAEQVYAALREVAG